jgi:hypothetical protein
MAWIEQLNDTVEDAEKGSTRGVVIKEASKWFTTMHNHEMCNWRQEHLS